MNRIITITTTELQKKLSVSAKNGNLQEVRELLDAGIGPDLSSSFYSPLCEAACSGHYEVVKLLVERGADVDMKTLYGRIEVHPLFLAAGAGHKEIVELLLDNGAEVRTYTSSRLTAIQGAVDSGHLEVVRVLLARGANPDVVDYEGITPLARAARSGFIEIANLLLAARVRVNTTTKTGWTPLHTASFHGHYNMVELLLARGAVVKYLTLEKKSSLCLASIAGHSEVAILLLDRGANIDDGSIVAACKSGRVEMVKLLLERGAKVDCQWDSTPLMEAAKGPRKVAYNLPASNSDNFDHIMDILLEYGADVNFVSENGTALQAAVLNKQPNAVWKLIMHGAIVVKTLWDVCEDTATREALMHFWTPQTHKLHPKFVREAIVCTLHLSKQQQWPFDQPLMLKIFSYIAFGWIKELNPEIHYL